ncbi:MAG: FeoB-associated Cys-rich membrane protein [Lautropia sp.]|nr:FeoB-associated Cys-rich membrane protein [Lautropia sp.]
MTQEIVVAIIFAVALVYVVRKFFLKKHSDSPCPGCGKCGGEKSHDCH